MTLYRAMELAGEAAEPACQRNLDISRSTPARKLDGILSRLIRNFSLNEFCEQRQRFLPAKIASLGRNDAGHAFLHNVQLRPAGHFLEGYGRLHFPGQVRVIEFVCVANTLLWLQLDIGSSERMALAGSEISERHLVGAADLCVHLVNLSRKSIRRKPFGHCIGVKERAIDFLRRGTKHAVKSDRICGG